MTEINKYQRWYDQLIMRAKSRKSLICYFERHHIQPRSLGGFDCAENFVDLTFREHFLAHWLLSKIHSGGALRKMQRALHAMVMQSGSRDIESWQMVIARRAIADLAPDPEGEAVWLAKFREAEAHRVYRRKYRLRNRNGSRAKQRRANLEKSHAQVASSNRLSRNALRSLAADILNPRICQNP